MTKTYIVSAGAVTGLGYDLAASTLAMAAKLDNFKETQFIDGSNENYIGSYIPVDPLSEGYPAYGVAKLKQLLKRAVTESLAKLGDIEENSLNSRVPYKKWSVVLVLSSEHLNQVNSLKVILQSIPILESATFYDVAIGSSGAGIAINTARSMLKDGTAEAVLIASMDTWLEPYLISLGSNSRRLLENDSEVGCIPAEAAVAVVLSHIPIVTDCPVALAGSTIGMGYEPVLLSDTSQPTMGRGLRDAYRQALLAAGIQMTDLHLRIGDVTGEEYFFEESINGYGAVLEGVMPKGYEALFTSSYLGDIKSASGLFSLAYIWQLAQLGRFNNKYAVSHMSSPTHAERTVVILQVGDSVDKPSSISDTILPAVVQQHIEEASLYWLRQQEAVWYPTMSQSDVARFNKAMQTHLDSILIAGEQGLELALDQLELWQTADEIFVSLYAYLNSDNQQAHSFDRIQAVLNKDSSLYAGVTAALSQTAPHISSIILETWWQQGTTEQRNAVFPVLEAHPSIERQASLDYALKSAYAPLRQQALKLIGELALQEYEEALLLAFENEPDALCKLEAACSLALLHNNKPIDAIKVTDMIDMQASLYHFMVWACTVSEATFDKWIVEAKQSKQVWVMLWTIFFHSNSRYLQDVIELLINDDSYNFTRMTGYVIQHLTGIDINKLNLWIQEDKVLKVESTNSSLSPNNLPKDYWVHPYQHDLMQTGLLYPHKDKVLDILSTLDIAPNTLVVNGQSLSIIDNMTETGLSMPQLALVELYRRV